ncbi:hypothetical protein BpHYR1_027443 [Brachionus plicatilis]|uniref:Uncharacterized protein n=1 Tax=Brachionus plicatilis TaxID=10195 RepID=A0A3M7SRX4_BRAPC|nr:hypothetical protein BpHYR1_027443 [Brachionus plicatilis]
MIKNIMVLAAFIASFSISFIMVLVVAWQPEDSFLLQTQDLYPIISASYLNRYFSNSNAFQINDNAF